MFPIPQHKHLGYQYPWKNVVATPLQKEDRVMQYTDSIDNSRQYLRHALEMIGKHGLPTDPLNYCIWYEYASGKNRALNAAIDNHLQSNGAFSEEICRQLFNQFHYL